MLTSYAFLSLLSSGTQNWVLPSCLLIFLAKIIMELKINYTNYQYPLYSRDIYSMASIRMQHIFSHVHGVVFAWVAHDTVQSNDTITTLQQQQSMQQSNDTITTPLLVVHNPILLLLLQCHYRCQIVVMTLNCCCCCSVVMASVDQTGSCAPDGAQNPCPGEKI